MILIVNGKQVPPASPLDRLTRAVVTSLFTWRRAEPDDNSDTPMGWWGDTWPTVQNDRIGSRLYLLRRTKLTNKSAPTAQGYIAQALAWMVEDGVAARVDATAERNGIETLGARVVIWQKNGSYHDITFDDIWSELNG